MVAQHKKYHPSKFARFVLYPAAFLVFMTILGLVLILANGYNFDIVKNKLVLEKTGMIIVASRPSEGEIFIDGKTTKKKTGFTFLPVKFQNVRIGDHDVKLVRDGYVTWEKKVTVNSNLVTWLNYVILFPNELKTNKVDALKDKSVLAQSKNNRYLFLSQKNDQIQNYYIYDTNSSSLTKTWPKADTPAEEWLKNPVISTAVFNANNDKLYVTVPNASKSEPVIFETALSGKVTSLSKTYNFEFTKATWDPYDQNLLYVLSKNTLYRLNVADLSPATLIADKVIDFSVERDRNLYFVSDNNSDYELHQASFDGSNDKLLDKGIVKDTAYSISYGSYRNAIAFLPQKDKTLTVYYSLNNQISSVQLARNIVGFEWSQSGKKILYYSASQAKSFDWEREEEISAPLGNGLTKIQWYFDDAHFLVKTKDSLFISDFDGLNKDFISKKTVTEDYLDPRFSSVIFKNLDLPSEFTKYFSAI